MLYVLLKILVLLIYSCLILDVESFPDGVSPDDFLHVYNENSSEVNNFENILSRTPSHVLGCSGEVLPNVETGPLDETSGSYDNVTPWGTPELSSYGSSPRSHESDTSSDAHEEPSSSDGATQSDTRSALRGSGRGIKRLREVYGGYNSDNGEELEYPCEGERRCFYLIIFYIS
jgi:hypothetical protein